jgi:plasmid stability protein
VTQLGRPHAETRANPLWFTVSVILRYTLVMKNITVAVPEEVYRRARVRAAELGSSVSALVADYLRSLADGDTEFAALAALQERVQDEIKAFRAGDRLSREQVHERALR